MCRIVILIKLSFPIKERSLIKITYNSYSCNTSIQVIELERPFLEQEIWILAVIYLSDWVIRAFLALKYFLRIMYS